MTAMYEMRPIISHIKNIDRPKCMYEMKKVNGDTSEKCKIVSEITGQFFETLKTSLGEASALESKQEKILGKLAELKQHVLNLYDILKVNNEAKPALTSTSCTPQTLVSENLVINVNPSRPCYSVLALNAIWEDVDIVISPFVHSNVKSKNLETFKTLPTGKTSVINIALIWKDVVDLEVITGIYGHVIIGESNLLRYLVRKLNNECYEKSIPSSKTIKIDRILDLSHQLVHQETLKGKQQILVLLNEKLGINTWFSGERAPNISDVTAWSAIEQSVINELPSNLKIWNKRCNEFLSILSLNN